MWAWSILELLLEPIESNIFLKENTKFDCLANRREKFESLNSYTGQAWGNRGQQPREWADGGTRGFEKPEC